MTIYRREGRHNSDHVEEHLVSRWDPGMGEVRFPRCVVLFPWSRQVLCVCELWLRSLLEEGRHPQPSFEPCRSLDPPLHDSAGRILSDTDFSTSPYNGDTNT